MRYNFSTYKYISTYFKYLNTNSSTFSGRSESVCDSSNNLASCLAEKGRANCSDWPMDDLPNVSVSDKS